MTLIAEGPAGRALGLVPFFADAWRLPAEDAVVLARRERPKGAGRIVAVPLLAHISNFDDFDPLKLEPGVELRLRRAGRTLPVCDLVILPGSKATIADLAFLRAQGWDIDLLAHARRGGKILGICGGYQMLGQKVADPLGVEGPRGAVEGLGLLDVSTELTGEKIYAPARAFRFRGAWLLPVTRCMSASPRGRIARGRCCVSTTAAGMARLRPAARSAPAYVHGLFAHEAQRAALLDWIGAEPSRLAYEAEVDRVLDALADHLESHIDLDALLDLAR